MTTAPEGEVPTAATAAPEGRPAVRIILGFFRGLLRTSAAKWVDTGRTRRRQASSDLHAIGDYLRSAREDLRPTSGRNVAVLVGSLLFLVGFLAAIVPLSLVATFVWNWLYGHHPAFLKGSDRRTATVCAAIAVVAPLLGRNLIAFKRRVALFLRRFGQSEPTRALGFAIEAAMGRSWRLVTLDDTRVQPVGVRKQVERLSKTVSALESVVLLGLVCGAARAYSVGHHASSSSGDAAARNEWDYVPFVKACGRLLLSGLGLDHGRPVTGGTYARGALMLVAFYGVVWLTMKASRKVFHEVIAPGFFWVFPFLWPQRGLATDEARGRVRIERERQIRRVVRKVVRQTRKLLSPQLVVVTVDTSIWTRVVGRFASVSSLVITDVSELSENLLFEIETFMPGSDRQWIFVGHRQSLEDRARQTAGSPPAAALDARLARALENESVLRYGDSFEDMKQFADALLHAIRPPGRPAPLRVMSAR